MKEIFKNHKTHHISLLLLAGPMILSNISVPLLGLVDTAVIGHLSEAHFLAGIALGSGSISLLFWLASFLRMSATGVLAQSYGAKNWPRLQQQLLASLLIAWTFSISLIFLSPWLLDAIKALSNASSDVFTQAQSYFEIRIFSAPAAMTNLVLLGLMLGMQYGKGPFYLLLFTNITNILLDILFVIGFDWQVAGAAWASVIADYTALLVAILLIKKQLAKQQVNWRWLLPNKAQFLALLSLNRDIFIRSLLLQLCFSFMTFYGARLGETTLAVNAVLLNFLMLVSFALDGIAYAAEAKVGQAKGEGSEAKVKIWVNLSLFWGAVFALLYSLVFAVFGLSIVKLLTNIPEVISASTTYLFWLILLPLLAMWCFIFDGIFVGLTRAQDMRNSMFFSAIFGFMVPIWLTLEYENHGLWFAMSCFMLLRGVTLAYRYRQIQRQGLLLQ
ncbi:MATE family efflux transporter [Pseudoalteromonas phenolica]|uniref:MATE family efflux transporter n=1 Tax=Pseudoalteromonas phenolica TaxID=161398 RepID=UPI00384C1B9D